MSSLVEFLAKESSGRLDAGEMLRVAKLAEYGFTVGFMLGGFLAGRQALLQFTAEHQHVFPMIKRRAEAVALVRHRSYRVMAAFGAGGALRGFQMGSVMALYGVARVGSARARTTWGLHTVPWVDDAVAGLAAGSSLALAGKGQRLHSLRRGAALGLALGTVLAGLRHLHGQLGQRCRSMAEGLCDGEASDVSLE